MGILHLIGEDSALEACLIRASNQDAVLFIENGVYALLKHKKILNQSNLKLYALIPDLSARGIEIITCVQGIDYVGFVDLAVEYPVNLSWR